MEVFDVEGVWEVIEVEGVWEVGVDTRFVSLDSEVLLDVGLIPHGTPNNR